MTDIFVHDREVPPNWETDLARLAPRSDKINWLKLVWEPGDPWEPVQRWEIREMVPELKYVPPDIIAALRGTDPRKEGRFVDEYGDCPLCEGQGKTPALQIRCTHCGGTGGMPTGRRVWESDAIISRKQWELFHETGCYSQRFWIIQGSHGGHKWRFSPVEQSYLKSAGRPSDTPAPGDLCYAEYDQRVFRKLAEHDRLLKWRDRLAWDARADNKQDAGRLVRTTRKDEEQLYAAATMKWLDTMIEDLVDDLPRSAIPDFERGDGHYNADEEALDRDLLLHTSTEI